MRYEDSPPLTCENCGCIDDTVEETDFGVLCPACHDIIGLEQLDMLGDGDGI